MEEIGRAPRVGQVAPFRYRGERALQSVPSLIGGVTPSPRTGVAVAANLQYFSGKPWTATAQINLPQGDQRILLEPRGSRRLSSQSLLDVRVSRRIALGGVGHIELLLDVLNVLNDTAEEGLATR